MDGCVGELFPHVELKFLIENVQIRHQQLKSLRQARNGAITHTAYFMQIRGGKMTNQRVGIDSFGTKIREIAAWLNKPDPTKFSGHSLRATAATLMAMAGASEQAMMAKFQWKVITLFCVECLKPCCS